MRFPLGEMTVGDVLDRAIRILLARLPVFYALNLLVLSPLIVVEIAGPLILGSEEMMDMSAVFATLGLRLLGLFVMLILQPIATASILHIVMEDFAGRRVSMGEALSFALSRFFPLLLASFLVGILVLIGVMLCCIPGIYFWVTYAFVGQIVVLERMGVSEAFQRSQNLLIGHWWRVFGVLGMVFLADRIVQIGVGVGLGFVLPPQEVIPVQNGFRIEVNPLNHVIDTLVVALIQILFYSYLAVCTTLMYLDLRIRKEGFDLELMAEGGMPTDRDGRDRSGEEEVRDRGDRYDDDGLDDRRRGRNRGRNDDDDYDGYDRGRNRDRDRDRYDDDDNEYDDRRGGRDLR